VLNQAQDNEGYVSSTPPDTVPELERKFSKVVSVPVNKEGSIEVISEPISSELSSQLGVTRSQLSASANCNTAKPQLSEKQFNTHRSNRGELSRFDYNAASQSSIGKGTCYWSCPCQCHPRKNLESPRWLSELLGILFYSYTGTPLFQLRPCNYAACQQRKTISCHLTYHFPQWLMKSTFMFTTCFQDLSGLSGSWSIGFPRSISASHDVWRCIEQGQYEEISQIIKKGTLMVNDMADDDGTSLLLVSNLFFVVRHCYRLIIIAIVCSEVP
jgi:hypothetical protein